MAQRRRRVARTQVDVDLFVNFSFYFLFYLLTRVLVVCAHLLRLVIEVNRRHCARL